MIEDPHHALPLPFSLQTNTRIHNQLNTQITKLYHQPSFNSKYNQIRLYENEKFSEYRKGPHLAVEKQRIGNIKEQLNLQ